MVVQTGIKKIDGCDDWYGTHIIFRKTLTPQGMITRRWSVVNKYGDGDLGTVKWFSRWRKYCFFPLPNCVFEEVCMREISEFITERTIAHKQKHVDVDAASAA